MTGTDSGEYLTLKLNYNDDADESLLDASLQRRVNLLLQHIKSACEVLYQWEVVDREAEAKTSELEDLRIGTSIWIPLGDLDGDFHRRTNHKLPRLFELEVAAVSRDEFSFTVFEDLTDPDDGAPWRYQAVAEADVERRALGLQPQPD